MSTTINNIIKNYCNEVKKYTNIEGQSKYLDLWEKWYKGYDKDFHFYTLKRTGTVVERTKKSLKAAKMVASDWANLIANEKCDIIIDEKDQDRLNEILDKNNFWLQLNNHYEQAMAMSIGAVALTMQGIEVSENGELVGKTGQPKLTFIRAKQIYPITIEGGILTEVAFAIDNTRTVDIIIYLTDENGNYKIHSLSCKKSSTGEIMGEDKSKRNVFNTQSSLKWFATFSPNIFNNLENNNLPISIYANSIDTLKAIDNKYDGFDIEFVNGKRKVFVSASLQSTKMVSDGQGGEKQVTVSTFDENDMSLYVLPEDELLNGKGASNKVQTSAEPLRSQDYISSLNEELNILSKQCGLGLNRFQFDSMGRPLQTATAVISVNSELYQNLRKHEIKLEQSLKDFTLAIITACNNFSPYEFKKDYKLKDIYIQFDDSIIEDKDAEQKRDKDLVAAGLLSEIEYRMRWRGETEEDAKKFVFNNLRYKLINNNLPSLTNGGMTPEEFVNICYGDKTEEEKKKIVEYVTTQKEKSSLDPLAMLRTE